MCSNKMPWTVTQSQLSRFKPSIFGSQTKLNTEQIIFAQSIQNNDKLFYLPQYFTHVCIFVNSIKSCHKTIVIYGKHCGYYADIVWKLLPSTSENIEHTYILLYQKQEKFSITNE